MTHAAVGESAWPPREDVAAVATAFASDIAPRSAYDSPRTSGGTAGDDVAVPRNKDIALIGQRVSMEDLVDRRGRRMAPGHSRRGQAGVPAAAGPTGRVVTNHGMDGSDPAPPATTGGRLV